MTFFKKIPFVFLVLLLAICIRFYLFSTVPASPYWEEVAVGYDSYSLLKTGRDHHGNFLPIVALESFGDWKPAFYAYATIPFIALFDLSVFAIRLPSLLAGIAIAIGTGVLARQMKISVGFALFFAAVSPWAILFSLAAWEANLAAALILWGVICLISAIDSTDSTARFSVHFRAVVGAVLLLLSVYTYHSARIVAPLLGLFLMLFWAAHFSVGAKSRLHSVFDFVANRWQFLCVLAVVSTILLVPLLHSLGSRTVTQRFSETSIFSDLSIIEESNEAREISEYSFVSNLVYHRYVFFAKEVISNYFSHFSLSFLFVSGDSNPRHSTQFTGTFYYTDAILLLFGLIALYKRWQPKWAILVFWGVIGIIPASITHASPHALRILCVLPVAMLLLSLGATECARTIEKLLLSTKIFKNKVTQLRSLLLVLVVAVSLIQLGVFVRYLTAVYPVVHASEWQYGYQEIVGALVEEMKTHSIPVYFSRTAGRPAMYYWFFSKEDPRAVQSVEPMMSQDQGEFLEYPPITFYTSVSQVPTTQQSLVVAAGSEYEALKDTPHEVIHIVRDPSNKIVWYLVKLHP